MYIEMLNKIM